MKLVKIFKPEELNLTEEEVREMAERCSGSADSCYEKIWIDTPEEAMEEYEDDEIGFSVHQKLCDTGLVEPGEMVMIDLCW